MSDPFALYVHVPYCRHVCPYCDFNVYAAADAPEREYVATVSAELEAHARTATWHGRRLKTVYVGGGTPSLLSPAAIGGLLDAAARCFGIDDGAEVSLEANPGTVTRERLAGYVTAGVNRLSLGAQSFDARHLRTLGRDHDAADIQRAAEAARAAAFRNVSLDLIFGVPGETPAEWERDLRAAIALAPDHVSAYALTYEEGTPFHAWRASRRIRAVGEDEEAAMADATVAILEGAGFPRYEISSFAHAGAVCRHNVSYWDGSDYLGVGPGSHSFSASPAPGRRWANTRVPARYADAVHERGTAIERDEPLTVSQARGEFVMTGLRRIEGIDTSAFERRFGTTADAVFPQIGALVADGLLERGPGRLRLSARGLAFADTVAANFL